MTKAATPNLGKDVAVDEDNLSTEFATFAAKFAWWVVKHAHSKKDSEVFKIQLEVLKANLDTVIRKKFTDAGTKFTEAVVAAAILQEKTYTQHRRQLLEMQGETGVLAAAVEAMRAKKDMLISLGAHKRAEMDSEIAIYKQKIAQQLKDS